MQLLECNLVDMGVEWDWRDLSHKCTDATSIVMENPITWDTCPSLTRSVTSAWAKQPMKLYGFLWAPGNWKEHGGLLCWSTVHHASELNPEELLEYPNEISFWRTGISWSAYHWKSDLHCLSSRFPTGHALLYCIFHLLSRFCHNV